MKRLFSRRRLQMFKLVLQCVFVLFLSTVTLLVGIGMSSTHIDLNRAEHSTGEVTSMEETRNKNGRSNLTLRIQGDEHRYSLYRFSQEYEPLMEKLSMGGVVTIYYNPSNSTSMNYEVYQVKTSRGVVYSKSEHENREQIAGRYIAIPGGILLFVGGCYDIRKRYKKLNDRQVVKLS
jgi:ribosomal protein L21E